MREPGSATRMAARQYVYALGFRPNVAVALLPAWC